MLGLKRGSVALFDHEREWETEAARTIAVLQSILGEAAFDIQHVGSTAIPSIKAKPIIDIVVAADDLNKVLNLQSDLLKAGFYYRPNANSDEQLLFAKGSFYDGTGNLQTHFIHVVRTGSVDYENYVYFRDYLNDNPQVAKEYEKLKIMLAETVPADTGRAMYLKGKHAFITSVLKKE